MLKVMASRVSEKDHTTAEQRVPKGYKQTEVGVIPEDWKVYILGEIGKFKNGLNKNSEAFGHGSPFVNLTDVFGVNSIVSSDHLGLVASTGFEQSTYELRRGDVIFVRSSVKPSGVGLTAVVENDLPETVYAGFLIRFRGHGFIDVEYKKHCFYNARFRRMVISSSSVSANTNINQDSLKKLAISLPPTMTEQKAIAGALSDADALIGSLERLIAKKRQIKQGAMQELLTGEKRLPGFSRKWEVKTIGELASPIAEKNSLAEVLPVMTCSKHLGFVDSLEYFKNQVFSKDTSPYKIIRKGQIGYPANHIEEGSIGLQDLYNAALVSPIYVVFSVTEGVDSFFLHRVLKLDFYRQKFKTATTSSVDRRGSLRWPAFSRIIVKLPPLPEQAAIAAIISDMDAETAALEAKLTKARMIKQGMMQELLTGKTRLI